MFELYLLFFLLLVILFIVFSSLRIGISPLPSSKKALDKIYELVKNDKNNTIIDLGSGFGILAIFLAKKLPHKDIIAYEISLIPYIFSIFLKELFFLKNIKIYKKDFLKVKLEDALLICYLFPEGMNKLENKILKEKINTNILSNTFAFRNIKYSKINYLKDLYKTRIYFYEKNKY